MPENQGERASEIIIRNHSQQVILEKIRDAPNELANKTKMKKRRQNIGIVAFPICEAGDVSDDTKAGNVSFSNLVYILHRLCDSLYVITGNKERILFKKDDELRVFEVKHKGGACLFTRVINYTFTQLKLSLRLAQLSKSVNLWIFFMGGAESLVLPILTAKLLRRQVVIALTGVRAKVSKQEKDQLLKIADLLVRINLALSTRIIVYSEIIVAERNLEKYRGKISIAHEHFMDFDRFKIPKYVIII